MTVSKIYLPFLLIAFGFLSCHGMEDGPETVMVNMPGASSRYEPGDRNKGKDQERANQSEVRIDIPLEGQRYVDIIWRIQNNHKQIEKARDSIGYTNIMVGLLLFLSTGSLLMQSFHWAGY